MFACYVARLRMCVGLYSSCFFFSFSWAPQFRTCSKQLGSNTDLLLSTQNFGKLGGRCWRATAVGIACRRLHLFLHALNVFTPVPTWALHFFGVQARLVDIATVVLRFAFCALNGPQLCILDQRQHHSILKGIQLCAEKIHVRCNISTKQFWSKIAVSSICKLWVELYKFLGRQSLNF